MRKRRLAIEGEDSIIPLDPLVDYGDEFGECKLIDAINIFQTSFELITTSP